MWKVSSSAGVSLPSQNIRFANSGRYGSSLGSGVYDIWVNSSGLTNAQSVMIENPTVYPGRAKLFYPHGQTVVRGDAGLPFPADTRFVTTTAGVFNGYLVSSCLTLEPQNPTGRGLDLREGTSGYTGQMLHLRQFGDTGDRAVMDAAGKLQWGTGDGSFDASFGRAAAGSVGGDVDLESTNSAKGLILKSPDGTRFRVQVADDGSLTTTGL